MPIETTLCGHPITIVPRAECRRLWDIRLDSRHELWTEEEAINHLLDTPEQLAVIIEKKRRKPGRY
jgi:hypothetical protein